MKLTIITPTYNRGDKLNKLFKSLNNQTVKDFNWLIIDDGSIDDTAEVVRDFMAVANFEIRYDIQENGGKHRALNKGISKITTELTIIVDSDDFLTENAVETILDYHELYDNRKESDKLCGFSFLRAYSNGEINTGEFPVDEVVDTYRQQRINNNLLGDKAEVYYTDILKMYPFEEFDGEKFMPEDAVWLKMSGPYNMVHINRVIYYCDYLEGGLTRTGRRMKIFSPYGMMYRSSVYLNDPQVNIKAKAKMAILYQVYSQFAKNRDDENNKDKESILDDRARCKVNSPMDKLLLALSFVPSKCIFLIWDRKYK
ncbi:glycosyltransferase family 2 protein [Butyrivibrio sp. XBB1001]|uniref:glycosyltransferase family 2 protein n=1 Tax=Butyrivibrio sp. XBB1001 TaxID=1280682 RepID=UPI000415EC25|nr:glycosyltransferase family A protein [Butyrivibrio sp. XBB1001]